MRIGFIGAGHIGGTLARHFIEAGHEVAISNSRGPETLQTLVAELGKRAHAMTPAQAAAFGDIVVVSIPFGNYKDIPADALDAKTVVDTNNYYPDRDGHFAELDADRITSSELLQTHLPRARVVKAFNTQYARDLAKKGRPSGAGKRVAIPIAGDDEEAKQTVARLIDQVGFDVVDEGTLAQGGRHLQPGSPIYGASLTREEIQEHLAF